MDLATRLGVFVAVALLLSVSGGLLWDIGYNYDGLTGSPITKIHPFTYMIAALFGWRSLTSGNPVGYFVRVTAHRPATLLMLTVAGALLVMTLRSGGPGVATYADVYIGAALLFLMLAEFDERQIAKLATLLHVVMAANALLTLYEFATDFPLLPYVLDGQRFPNDFRPAGLQGHPLVNASITAIYLMALMAGRAAMPTSGKIGLIGLQVAAVLVSGGRAALVTSGALGGAYVAWLTLRAIRENRVPLLGAASACAIVAVVPVVAFATVASGSLDQVLLRFVSDGGSAESRAQMFDLFQYFSWRELLVGPDPDLVNTVRRINGLEWGIENPVVRMLLYQGAFVTFIMLGSFALFLIELARNRSRAIWWPMLATVILLNTSESIGGKTTMVSKIVIILVCLFRTAQAGAKASQPRAAFSPSASTMAGSSVRA